MEFFSDLIQYGYLSNALAACVLSGITCGVIGTYVVCRRMVFLAGGITHSSFGGLGIAFYLGTDPIAGAMIFAVLSALGIEWAGSRGRIREDSAIGIIWSVGMAVGALFMSLRPGYTSGDLSAYLFGSIVTVTHGDVAALTALTLFIIAGALLWLRPVLYVAFDRDFARDGGADRRDDRPLDPHHGNRPADFAAHDARCHRQFALALVPDHRALRAAGRRGGQRRRTRRKLQFRSSARSSHNIYTHSYAYCSKTITFA